MMSDRIVVPTAFGKLIAEPSTDPDYPGIWILLVRKDDEEEYETAIALIESWQDIDLADTKVLRAVVFGDMAKEDVTHDVRIARICGDRPDEIVCLA